MLEAYIRDNLKHKDILLMTHIVMGYPSFQDSYRIIQAMVNAGVDLMELQVPFSDPIADGPVILRANQEALNRGATVKDCLDLAEAVTRDFDIPFLIMTYNNILFKYGTTQFVSEMANRNLHGAIIPDLPPEEGDEFINAMETQGLAPIPIFSPTTSLDRMKYLSGFARGFVYCVARKGVTGADTSFSKELADYLFRCRQATALPLALGFGVKQKSDVNFLKGKADIAVIGTQTIRLVEKKGVDSVESFIRSLS